MPRETVLVADDEPTNLLVISEVVRPTYAVRVANDGAGALRAAVTPPRPDLVLLDVMMPGMDGYEVLRRLREDDATSDLPVVFLTALAEVEHEERGLEAGAADYLTKPIRPGIVRARVRTQLDAKRARDLLRDSNDFLQEEVRRRVEETARTEFAGIRALAHLAETRDTDTGVHILRTQRFVEALARAEHDVGKPVAFLPMARTIARSHHERWDGSGYPDGLAGDTIPIPARLMAVADVFDALISKRVYKEAMPIDQARAIIVEGRGTHFDPDVVAAFEEDFDAFATIAA